MTDSSCQDAATACPASSSIGLWVFSSAVMADALDTPGDASIEGAMP